MRKLKVGYAKLGRSFPVRYFKSSSLGGDQAVIRLLDYLRAKYEVHLIGPNQGVTDLETYGYAPENVVNHWLPGMAFGDVPTVPDEARDPVHAKYCEFLRKIDDGIMHKFPALDACVIWLGQHSSVSSFLPPERDVEKDHVRPLMSQINYVYPILRILNRLKIKPIWLHPDARNILKCRDLTDNDQREILSQYDREHVIKSWHPAEGTRDSHLVYRYSGIDLLVLPPESTNRTDFETHLRTPPEQLFGAVVNEGLHKKNGSRLEYVERWCGAMDTLDGWELVGHWDLSSQMKLQRKVTPVPNTQVRQTLRRWRSTITFPPTADSHAKAWVGAKQWECFSAGVVCFRPKGLVDVQGHAYGDNMPRDLREFLTVDTPYDLVTRVERLRNDSFFRHIADLQFRYFVATMAKWNNGLARVQETIESVALEQPWNQENPT